MKVGADLEDDVRRAALIREEIGPERIPDDGRQPGLGRRPGDRRHPAPGASSIRGGSRSRPAPTTCSVTPGSRASSRPVRIATGEHCQNRVMFKQLMQAGRDRGLPGRRVPAGRRQRGARGAAAGREVRDPGVPARRRRRPVASTSSTCRWSTTSRCRAGSRTGGSNTSTTCTSTSSHPARIRDGRYLLPEAPGYSIEMLPESLEQYSFPDGPVWR